VALAQSQLAELESVLAQAGTGNPVPRVRAALPGVAVSRCDPEDLTGEVAFRQIGCHAVYLVDTASHCWRIVDTPAQAGGVVITTTLHSPSAGSGR
jgi:hypothetical protein